MSALKKKAPPPPDVEDAEADDELVRRLAQRLGHTYVRDLAEVPVDPAAVALVPINVIRRHRIVPLGFEDEKLVVAVADPGNVIGLDDVRTLSDRVLKVLVGRSADVDELVGRLHALDQTAETFLDEAASGQEDADEEHVLTADDAPIVKAAHQIIMQAVQQRASDIHIEPEESDVRIRFRIDGVLTESMRTRKTLHAGLVSRLKVMADLDISEKRLPQDGRITVNIESRKVDLRVATAPTAWGEKVVLRVLDRSAALRTLSDIGFPDDALELYSQSMSKPYGALLLTGPTGSGKSSTLYATLQAINDDAKNIITIEDPVEARIPGINQMQVNPRAGLTFATALRSILRADPDVIMVGEMRDRETAALGIEAALTGHLVLTTLHTNDAASAVTRLTEMGIEPFLVSSAVECVVAQRLVRRLCPRCAEEYQPTAQMLLEHGIVCDDGMAPPLRRIVGCNYCSQTGYFGRVALIEIMRMSDEIRRLTVEHHSTEDIRKQALIEGMRTLRDDGMQKALDGITTVEEVLRVVA